MGQEIQKNKKKLPCLHHNEHKRYKPNRLKF